MEDRADIQSRTQRQFMLKTWLSVSQADRHASNLGKSAGDGDGSDWTHSASLLRCFNWPDCYTTDTVAAQTYSQTLASATSSRRWTMLTFLSTRELSSFHQAGTIMGIDRYVSSDFVSGQGVQNGLMGELYSIPIAATVLRRNCIDNCGWCC